MRLGVKASYYSSQSAVAVVSSSWKKRKIPGKSDVKRDVKSSSEGAEMERYATSRLGLYRISALTVMVLLMLCWTSIAQAQQGGPPADEQYGNPAAAVGPTVGEDAPEAAGTSAASTAGSEGGVVSVLPETGGPMLALLALGGVALLGAGMLLMRRASR